MNRIVILQIPRSRICVILLFGFLMLIPKDEYSQTMVYPFLARGADSSEIFLSSFWYAVPNQFTSWGAIFHSTDNGRTLTRKSYYNWLYRKPMVYGDSMSGVIYLKNIGGPDTLMVSHDYGVTYTPIYTGDNGYGEFASGCSHGEFYLGNSSNGFNSLKKYCQFGDSMHITNSNFDLKHLMDVGTEPGELFAMQYPYVVNTIAIAYSNDYGKKFSVYYQDTSLIENIYRYTWSRGTLPGELYMAGQHQQSNRWHIFHSFDYGQTISLSSITDPWISPSDYISFTAGRSPGSFYILRSVGYLSYCADLWIYYSQDYGQTFTTFYHHLDSLLTGINSPALSERVRIYPNPASDKVTLQTDHPCGPITVELMDITGRVCLRKEFQLPGETFSFDVSRLQEGMYVLRCTTEINMVLTEKLVIRKY